MSTPPRPPHLSPPLVDHPLAPGQPAPFTAGAVSGEVGPDVFANGNGLSRALGAHLPRGINRSIEARRAMLRRLSN